jgi:hypothetical protein
MPVEAVVVPDFFDVWVLKEWFEGLQNGLLLLLQQPLISSTRVSGLISGV